jgi:lipoprotein-anchoring transpeptidase ErfK/SrfK
MSAATPVWAQEDGGGSADPTTTTSTSSTTSTTIPPSTTLPELPSPDPGAARAQPSAGLPREDGQIQLTEPPPPPPEPTTTTTLPPDVLPANSGEGRRAVYSKSRQRVWTVEADGTVSRTYLVSGRLTWNQPKPGEYRVFSRSSYTCNIKDPSICWRYMVRFTVGPEGDNIGFHEIPNKNGRPVQSVWQLGTALSGGCVRQATPDAQWMWEWAPVGTKVVVLA